MQTDGIAGYLLQSDAADGAHLCAEVAVQQVLAQSDALENLRATIGADGRDAHLRHNLLQTLVHGLDVVAFGGGVVLLNLPALHQVVEHGEGHIRAQRRGSVAQQQRRMHRLANLTALHDERRLHALAHRNQIVMDGRDSQQ